MQKMRIKTIALAGLTIWSAGLAYGAPIVSTISASGNWSDSTKWSNGVANGIDDTANIQNSGGSPSPFTLNIPATVGTLQRNGGNNNSTWQLNASGGNELTMQVSSGTAMILATHTAARSMTINPNVIIASDLLIRAQGSGNTTAGTQSITLNGTLTGTGNLTLEANNTTATDGDDNQSVTLASLGTVGSLTVQGSATVNNTSPKTATVTIGAIGSGVTTLTKTGTSRLILTSANSYTGDTNINAGLVQVQTLGTLGNSDTYLNDGTLELQNATSLSDSHALNLFTAPTTDLLNLNFLGTDTIGALKINGVSQGTGIWDADDLVALGVSATGSGALQVVPEPATLALAAGGLLMLGRRRRA